MVKGLRIRLLIRERSREQAASISDGLTLRVLGWNSCWAGQGKGSGIGSVLRWACVEYRLLFLKAELEGCDSSDECIQGSGSSSPLGSREGVPTQKGRLVCGLHRTDSCKKQ